MNPNFIKTFLIRSGILLVICIIITIIFDPFYQYHQPLPGLKAVLTDKEYQCIGSLRTFDYDSVIVGSSVVENNYNGWYDQGFDCKTIKAIRTYGATADLCFLLDAAFEDHDLKYVFYNVDTSALDADPIPTYNLTGCPLYLYDKNYFNDIEYVLNKSVLIEKIPYLLANSFIGDYDENNSYNWAQWKEFNQDMILGLYIRKPSIAPMKEKTAYQEQLDGNLALLTEQVANHPETEFKFFFPPYSIFYWDNIYRNGKLEAYLYDMEQAVGTLLTYENVEVYYFQNAEEIISNLDNYMDILHFSPDVNYWMYEQIAAGNYRLTADNYMDVLEDMRKLAYRIVEEDVLPYEDLIKFDLYDDNDKLF